MCAGKSTSEVKRSCTSSCKNFARCTARLLALEETLLDSETTFDIAKRPAVIPTSSRTLLAVVNNSGTLSFA